MNEDILKKLLKAAENEVEPPEELRERIFENITMNDKDRNFINLSPVEKFIFERPLRTACVLGSALSGILWALMGSGYVHVLSGFAGVR